MRLNPFTVVPTPTAHDEERYDVGRHIDQLRSLFVASFGLWNPLPAVLEKALYGIYAARGWALDANPRVDVGEPVPVEAFPTLGDLALSVEDVIRQLGYHREVADNMRSALSVRVNALRVGAKGRMFDTLVPFDPRRLFDFPTVVELEGLGDSDDKAFLMGLLIIQLAAYRRAQGPQDRLVHLLVVEEAHRLLRNVAAKGSQEETNTAFHAVETFADLLAEVRALGQGIVIADQVPTGLAPAVIKNTNLKVVHRLVAQDDRQTMAGSMVMTPMQARYLATLPKGRAAVFSEGDDSPLLVDIDELKGLRDAIRQSYHALGSEVVATGCEGDPSVDGRCCPAADALMGTAVFRRALRRMVTTTLATAGEVARTECINDIIRPAIPGRLPYIALRQCALGKGIRWLAEANGAARGWTYLQTAHFRDALRLLLIHAHQAEAGPRVADQFRSAVRPLFVPDQQPYQACELVCPDRTCFYRGDAADLIATGLPERVWNDGSNSPLLDWSALSRSARHLIDWHSDSPSAATASRHAGLCLAQQVLVADDSTLPEAVLPEIEHLHRFASQEVEKRTDDRHE